MRITSISDRSTITVKSDDITVTDNVDVFLNEYRLEKFDLKDTPAANILCIDGEFHPLIGIDTFFEDCIAFRCNEGSLIVPVSQNVFGSITHRGEQLQFENVYSHQYYCNVKNAHDLSDLSIYLPRVKVRASNDITRSYIHDFLDNLADKAIATLCESRQATFFADMETLGHSLAIWDGTRYVKIDPDVEVLYPDGLNQAAVQAHGANGLHIVRKIENIRWVRCFHLLLQDPTPIIVDHHFCV